MDDIFIPVAAILMPLGIVTVVTKAKHRARVRENEHRERMKALDMGISPYGRMSSNDAWPGVLAAGMGILMPSAVFLFAWLASMTADSGSSSGSAAFLGATLVGGVGVLGGLKMGGRMLSSRGAAAADRNASALASRSYPQANGRKPAFDPDAYDAIAHRG